MTFTDSMPGSLHELSGELSEVLEKEGILVRLYNLSKLIRLMEILKNGRYNQLSSAEKQLLLYNFLELINQKEMKGITIVACKIFQEETIIPDTCESLPPFLLMALTDFFRQERVDNNKAVILKLFLSKESQILKWLLLEDIIFAVWSEDPSFQSRVINFVIKNYTLRNLVSTLVSHSKAIGKKLPSAILNSLVSKDPDADTFERKKEILIILKEASSLGDKTVTKVWMEYVKALNRQFEGGSLEFQ